MAYQIVLILLVALAVRLIYPTIRRNLAFRRFARLHGCQSIAKTYNKDPFLGLDTLTSTLRAITQHRILEQSCHLYKTYGKTFRLQELHRPLIFTVEPENLKTILSLKFHDYSIGHRLAAFKPLLGEGIFDTDGEHWSQSRALIRPSFTREKVADLTTFETLFQDLMVLLPRDGRTVIDLQELFFRYTIDSATEFLFGQSVNTLRKDASELDFANAFHEAQKAVIKRVTLGPLSGLFQDKKAEEYDRICRDFAGRFVDEAFDSIREGRKGDEKFIFSHELASRTTDRRRVLDEVMNVLLAGRDTTASLLSNLFFMLAKRPEIWEKLRREVAGLEGRPPTYEELRSLKYVQCCLNESLRLHPVVPRNERQAVTDTFLPVGGGPDGSSPVFVPKGTYVCYSLYAMHRRQDIYGSDAEVFRPERWENGRLQPKWGYLPFNGGPRICIGQRYALTEAGYVLVRMVQMFKGMKCCDSGEWEESLTLTMCSRNGVRVALVPDESALGGN